MTRQGQESTPSNLPAEDLAEAIEALSRRLQQMAREGRIEPQQLEAIAHQLKQLTQVLRRESIALENQRERIQAAIKQLGQTVEHMQQQQVETHHKALQQHLRAAILHILARRGSLLPIELAAATLSLPEEIQPVLEELAQEHLVEIHEGKRGRWVSLTERGRMEAKRMTAAIPV